MGGGEESAEGQPCGRHWALPTGRSWPQWGQHSCEWVMATSVRRGCSRSWTDPQGGGVGDTGGAVLSRAFELGLEAPRGSRQPLEEKSGKLRRG